MSLDEFSQQGLASQRAAFDQQRRMSEQAGLGALGQAQQQQNMNARAFIDRSVPKIKYKPTMEANDNIRDVLQAETDEWLNEVK